MRRRRVALLVGLAGLLLTACGSKEQEADADARSESREEQQEEEKEQEQEEEKAEKEEEAYSYLNVVWQKNGLFYCADESGNKYIVDEDSQIVAELPGDVGFKTFSDDSQTCGSYFTMQDESIWTLEGEKVFALEDSGYDGIFYTDTLDADYLILYKEVNTFEETGKHYFAYNVKDGSSYQLEGVKHPDKDEFSFPGEEYWYYFGNGNFIYAPPNSGFGNEHLVFHLQTGETVAATLQHADGSVTDTMPDIYFWDAYHYDDEAFYGIYLDEDNYNYRMIYRFDTGVAELRSLRETVDYEDIWVVEDTRAEDVVELGMGQQYKDEHSAVMDYMTGVITPMEGYKDFEVLLKKDGAYFCLVKNDGGGKFAAVVELDGSRRFEPIPVEDIIKYNENYFALRQEDGSLLIYDWNGKETAQIPVDKEKCAFGETTIVYTDYGSDGDSQQGHTYLTDALTGKTQEIEPLEKDGDEWLYKADYTESYEDGYYVSRGAVLSVDGEFKFLRLREEA